MTNLSAINPGDAAFMQAQVAAFAGQENMPVRSNGAPQGQSFASAMDNASSSQQGQIAVMAQLAQNGEAVSRLPPQHVPRAVSQNHIEQVLGDSLGITNARALAQLSELMDTGGDSSLDVARNVVSSRSVLATLSGQVVQSPSGYNSIRRSIAPPAAERGALNPQAQSKDLAQAATLKSGSQAVSGALSSRFESGEDGIAAIGYDRHGGTSYGKYQIASKVGSMDSFIQFLRTEAPAYAKRLKAAGEANTGSRSGAMPDEWRKIAKENPALFEDLQERFIHDSHYKPALQAVSERTGLGREQMSPALQEVLWSTAVQHGPSGAARIFSRALEGIEAHLAKNPGSGAFEKAMIENVYAARSNQFGSSTQRVQNAVQNRLEQEKGLALAMVQAV